MMMNSISQLKTLVQQQHKSTIKMSVQDSDKNDQTECVNRDANSCCAPVYRRLLDRGT